jgi:hypothetical protein
MRDLRSKGWIAAKGVLFCVVALATAGLLLLENPSTRNAVLLGILVWSSCRFYYFLFYVLEKYVDPALRYSGLLALAGAVWRRGEAREEQ